MSLYNNGVIKSAYLNGNVKRGYIGERKVFGGLSLISNGVVSSILGGISKGVHNNTTGTITENDGYIRFGCSRGTFPFYANSSIDLTSYSKCIITFRTKNNRQRYNATPYTAMRIGFASAKMTTSTRYNIITSSTGFAVSYTGANQEYKTIELDISGLNGLYYFEMKVQSSGGGITNYMDITDVVLS